jgi:hypothetical protein
METFWMITRVIDCLFTITLIYLFCSRVKFSLKITDETIAKFSKEQRIKYEELKDSIDEFNKK